MSHDNNDKSLIAILELEIKKLHDNMEDLNYKLRKQHGFIKIMGYASSENKKKMEKLLKLHSDGTRLDDTKFKETTKLMLDHLKELDDLNEQVKITETEFEQTVEEVSLKTKDNYNALNQITTNFKINGSQFINTMIPNTSISDNQHCSIILNHLKAEAATKIHCETRPQKKNLLLLKEGINREKNKCNTIIYGVDESIDADFEINRISALLNTNKPIKIFRLGKINYLNPPFHQQSNKNKNNNRNNQNNQTIPLKIQNNNEVPDLNELTNVHNLNEQQNLIDLNTIVTDIKSDENSPSEINTNEIIPNPM